MIRLSMLSKRCTSAVAAAVGLLLLCPALAFAADSVADSTTPLSVGGGDSALVVQDDSIDISGAKVVVPGQTYTGSALKPAPTVTLDDGATTLVAGTDYTVKDADYTNAGTYTVTVEGTGNYSGKATGEFVIAPASVAGAKVAVANQTYTGSALRPAPTVTLNGKTLVAGTDYKTSYASNTKAGTAKVTVKGTGNYADSASANFTINPASISKTKVVLAYTKATYTGKAMKPGITVTFGGKSLVRGKGYTLAYTNNKNAGTAIVKLTGKGNFTGVKTVKFKIVKAKIGKATFSGITKKMTYNAKVRTQNVVAKYNGKKLKAGTDYKITYLNSNKKAIKAAKVKAAGVYYVKITGKGNFTGTKIIRFKIFKAKMSTTNISNIKNLTYNGSLRKQNPVVKFAGNKLKKNKAYTITYLNSKKKVIDASQVGGAGTYYVRIKGIGNFKGSVTKKFVIKQASVTNATVQGVLNKLYNGVPQTQNPTVKFNGRVLTSGKDYTLSYSSNINAGTAWMAVTGAGNFTGTAWYKFTIQALPITSTVISKPTVQKYTGSPVRPEPTVIARGQKLTRGTDYTVAYLDNVKEGTATMLVMGMGNYTGTARITFQIRK